MIAPDVVPSDAASWTIISAMAVAISAMGIFIRTLYRSLDECQRDRVRSLEDQLAQVREARKEAAPPAGQGGDDDD